MFIGIDISKNSTAVCVESKKLKIYSYTTKKSNNIWVTDTSEYINYRFINYTYSKTKDYSEREGIKFKEFEETTNLIVNDILDNVNILETINIAIEGYSYGSPKGHLIDIVEFSTLLKHKIKTSINQYLNVKIIAPLALKSKSCELVYEPRTEIQGKRVIKEVKFIENPEGKKGKDFDKWDMFKCFLQSNISSELKDYLKDNQENILKLKEVPKPLDDVIDSIFLKEVYKSLI